MNEDLPLIVGTAGHVDHGKTTLIRALTGVDTDRLAEEKRRGMTIDLGFAPFRLPSGRLAGVVDVPGHEKFLKNMLAGAGGIDLVLLVVAADDGVMPQTREHLAILETLRVASGLVVVTKTDLVDPELLELAIDDVRGALEGSFLAGAPVLPVSASDGTGLDALKAAIEAAADSTPPREADAPFRLPIDRVFVKQGFGTVVTGTLLSGRVAEGDTVSVEPEGLKARVRGLQVHGEKRDQARAGQRVALNLAGLERQELARGAWLAAPGALAASTLLDVQIELGRDAAPLAHRTRVRLHHGTAELIGRVALLEADTVEPGGRALAQIVLERPVAAAHGDRFVLRRYAPMELLGGGSVLHPAPAKHRRRQPGVGAALGRLAAGDAIGALAAALAASGERAMPEATLLGYVPAREADAARAWLAEHALAVAGGYVDRGAVSEVAAALKSALGKFHQAMPWRVGLGREELAARTKRPLAVVSRVAALLLESGELAASGKLLALAGHRPVRPVELERAREAALTLLAAQPLADEEDFSALGAGDRLRPLLEDMAESGDLVRVAGSVYAAAGRLDELKQRLREHFASEPQITASQARERLGTTRKYLIPFLEYLDAQGFTRRQGDVRLLLDRA